MFGFFRFCLALMVVMQHLLSLPVLGHFAVHAFFILSGYLMTYVLHKQYGYQFSGKIRFLLNRATRLYPMYWLVLILSYFVVKFVGEDFAINYREFLYVPNTLFSWFQNIFMIYWSYFPGDVSPRLSPPTWALTVELLFYVTIAVGISKSKVYTALWFLVSVFYIVFTYIFELDYGYRYNNIFSGSLPFAIGALIFHYREEILNVRFFSRYSSVFVFGAFFLVNIVLSMVMKYKDYAGFYFEISYVTNYFICFLMICSLMAISVSGRYLSVDKFFGDLSYPVYLIHWQVGLVSSWILFERPVQGHTLEGIVSFLLAIIITISVSKLLVILVDSNMSAIRSRIRKK